MIFGGGGVQKSFTRTDPFDIKKSYNVEFVLHGKEILTSKLINFDFFNIKKFLSSETPIYVIFL